jgi:hypothetical protein
MPSGLAETIVPSPPTGHEARQTFPEAVHAGIAAMVKAVRGK